MNHMVPKHQNKKLTVMDDNSLSNFSKDYIARTKVFINMSFNKAIWTCKNLNVAQKLVKES